MENVSDVLSQSLSSPFSGLEIVVSNNLSHFFQHYEFTRHQLDEV
jgi:hypothetical protein